METRRRLFRRGSGAAATASSCSAWSSPLSPSCATLASMASRLSRTARVRCLALASASSSRVRWFVAPRGRGARYGSTSGAVCGDLRSSSASASPSQKPCARITYGRFDFHMALSEPKAAPAWWATRSEGVNTRAASCMALERSESVNNRAASSLQMQPQETVVASCGAAKMAILTVLRRGSRPGGGPCRRGRARAAPATPP